MALTRDQWISKLRSMVPAWWFERDAEARAVIDSYADVFLALEQDGDLAFDSTFVLRAIGIALDALGSERSIDRMIAEIDSYYAKRIQRITSLTDRVSIKAAVDELLINGECTILESPADAPYCSRGAFASRSSFMLSFGFNEFLVLVPKQQHAPYSFASRSVYCTRLNFAGTVDVLTALYSSIIATINRLKAFGVLYGIAEIT